MLERWNGETDFQLYDMAHDPLELHDLAAEKPEIVAQLKAEYDAWFSDVTATRDYSVPSRIFLGAPQENPVLLTRQDWRGGRASWGPKGIGYWEVNVVAHAGYEIKLRFEELKNDAVASLACGSLSATEPLKAGATRCTFPAVQLPAGPARFDPRILQDKAVLGVKYVEVRRLD